MTTTTAKTIASAVAAFTILLLQTHLVLCDKPRQSGAAGNPIWDLARPRDGRFLNVPIFYGDWVPITNAKSVIERVAASLQPDERADDKQPLDGHDRADHHHHGHDADVGNVDHTQHEADHPGLPHGPGHGHRQRHRHNEGDKRGQHDRADHRPHVFIDDTLSPPAAPVKTQQQAFAKPAPLPQQRPHWRQRPLRRQDKKRRTRKLPPPQPQSYFEKFTSFFTGGSSSRVEDETSPSVASQPPPPLPTQVGPSLPPLPSLPVHRPPPPPLPKSQPVTSPPKVILDTFPSSSVSLQTTFNVNTPNNNRFTHGKVYDISNQYRQSQTLRLQTGHPTAQKTQHYHHNQQQQQHHHNLDQQQHTQTQNHRGQGRQPNIRILPAPDLSKEGPPLIEIGGGVGPAFYASPGATEQSHLSGFVPVNFEPLTSGEPISSDPLLEKKPRNFSVVLGTDAAHQVKSPKHLAKLFKDGRLKKEAFISPSNAAPDGFKKIDLPFMEKHEGGHLPSVFIAPVGFQVPDGYKGHPLPYDPEVKVTTVPTFGGHGDEDFLTSPLVEGGVKNKLKLAKDRPSLAEFYRNKARKESDISQDFESGEDKKRKKKRVLTKVVRRPAYKISKSTGATVPSAPEEEHTTNYPLLRIDDEAVFVTESPQTHILDEKTKLPPLITPGSVVGSLFDPITQTYTWQEITEDRNAVEEATARASSTTASATTTTGVPYDAGTSTEKSEENEEWQTTIRLDLEYFAPTTQRPSTEHQFILVTTTTEEPEVEQTTEVPTAATTAASPTQRPTAYPTTPAIAEEGTEADERVPETTSQATDFYEPTPFNNFKPVRKYDGLRYKNRPKQQHVRLTDFSPTKLPRVRKYKTTTTPDTTTVNSKYRGGGDGGGRIFGTRIRARKRPTFWANGYSKESRYEATTTTSPVLRRRPTPRKSSKTEEYKKKYRPLFDKLYEKLTKGTYDEEEFKKESKEIRKEIKRKDQTTRRYWRGRSTTTPNPYTINAEIYEVHPDSGRTWVPAIVTTTTEQHTPVAESTYAPDLQFGDFDQQSLATNSPSPPEAPLPTIRPTLPPLEYNEYKLPGTEGYVHETADKHSTPTHPTPTERQRPTTTVPTTTGSVGVLNPQTPYTYPEAPINYDYAANDVIDRADQTLNYDDDTDWDIGNTNLVDEVSSANPGRLSEYAKGISPSDNVANAHNKDYVKPVNIVNEHSQQRIDPAVEEGSFVPFLESSSWKPSYVEIDRSTTLSPPTTDVSSLGDDVIYITEEDVAFDKSRDTFSVPVGTSFDVPSANIKQVTTTTTATVEDETTPYHTTIKIDSTSRQEQEASPSTIRVTTPEPEITTYTRRIIVTTTARQQTQDHGEEISTPTSQNVEQTTKVDGAPTSTTVIAADDGSASTLSTTDYQQTETPAEPEVSTVAQDAVTAKVTTTGRIAWVKSTTGSSHQTSTGLENVDTTSTESETSTRNAEHVTTTKEATTAGYETTETIPERIRFRKKKPLHPPPPPKKSGFLSGLLNFFLPSNKVPQRKIPEHPVRRVDNIEASSQAPTTFETTHTESTAGPKTTTTEVDSTSAGTSTENSLETTRSHSSKVPKAIDTSSVKINIPVTEEQKEEGEGGEGIAAYTTPKSVLEDKLDAVVKKREQLIKNWTARKYKKGDKKSRYAAATTTTEASAASESEDATDSGTGETTTFLPFAPTVRPKSHRLPLKKGKKKITRKPPPPSILNYKKHLLKDSGIFASEKKKKKKAIPIGSRPDVYKKWEGGSLSQAEFERKVLGVSTATEVSVKSMICVRGRCFNAEDEENDDDRLR